jgi:ribosomal subunit interface protein
MQIHINTDRNIEGHEALAAYVTGVVQHALSRISSHITRVEVHLGDENSNKTNRHDMRCVMEARLERYQPVAVTHHADTLHKAIDGAVDKLTRKIDSTIERLHDQKIRSDGLTIPEPILPEA